MSKTSIEKKQKSEIVEMTFWDHLDVLRFALMRSFAVVFILAIVAFYFTDFVYSDVILGPKNPDFISNRLFCKFGHLVNIDSLCINQIDFKLNNLEMAGQFRNNLLISLIAGLVVAMPYILTEIWLFIKPALTPKERKGVSGFVFVTTVLFMIGVSFGYFIIAPLAVNFLATWTISPDIQNTFRLVTPELLKTYRKHAIVAVFILSAMITPPDVFSQILVAFPLIFLYEISIRIAKRVERKKVKEL